MTLSRTISVFALVFLAFLAGTRPAAAFSVDNIRFGSHPDKVRMVLDLSAAQDFRVFTQEGPWRIVIDLPAFDWRVGGVGNQPGAGVNSIRQGALQPGVSRIVIDFHNPISVAGAFLLPANQGRPDRLVVDFQPTDEATARAGTGRILGRLNVSDNMTAAAPERFAPVPVPAATPHQHQSLGTLSVPPPRPTAIAPPIPERAPAAEQILGSIPIPVRKPADTDVRTSVNSPTPRPTAERPLIVIDPGHGGVDPGAVGAQGVFEKHVTLSMARELKNALEETGRYRVLLTREKDTYLKLYQRVAIARQNGAALFVSLHADSMGRAQSSVQGASVYTLSEKASDEQSALLADRENRADLVAGMDLGTEDEQVATILADLTVRDTMNQSKFFANKLVDTMAQDGVRLLDNPHRYAGFAVLKAPDVPSVLVELGFLSNPREAAQLNKPEYRRTIAQSLVAGIDTYFEKIGRESRS